MEHLCVDLEVAPKTPWDHSCRLTLREQAQIVDVHRLGILEAVGALYIGFEYWALLGRPKIKKH